MRTSLTHPLIIGSISPGPGLGRIGITLCPGKKDPHAMSGAWDRDLAIDLDAITRWGAVAVVTLLEQREMMHLRVTRLGVETESRHMTWFHLPIADGSIPDDRFEQEWVRSGEAVRALLRRGASVLIHCRGGLGRAGTIAARLLVELGVPPNQAITAVRKARPDSIETREQENFIRAIHLILEPMPSTSADAIRCRAVGTLVGLAVGDAIGTTLEFKPRDSSPRLTDMVGGGPFRLRAGQWTDDTAMALALADSLAERGRLELADLMSRFVLWWREGRYSCTGGCFDIGITTRAALERFRHNGDPLAGSESPNAAGNGSLMRLSPVAIRYWNDEKSLRGAAQSQSRTTHAAPAAVDACVAMASMLADAIAGKPATTVFRNRGDGFASPIAEIMDGSWRGKPRAEIKASGYVAHTLEAAVWSVGRTPDFESAILTAANLGEDADTTAAVAGQLAGALYGADAIPPAWRDRLAWRDRIEGWANKVFGESIQPPHGLKEASLPQIVRKYGPDT